MSLERKTEQQESIPFYPDHVKTEFRVVIGIVLITIVLGALGLFFPVGLQDPADPLNTPTHVKPEWYFLALYQVLKFIPKTIGALLPVIGIVLLALWPFFDKKQEITKRPQTIRIVIVAVALVVIVALTIWGEVS